MLANLAVRKMKQRGFTLVEVLVATIVLMTGVVAVAQLVPVAVTANNVSRRDSTALVIAQRELAQMMEVSLGLFTFTDALGNACSLGSAATPGATVGSPVGGDHGWKRDHGILSPDHYQRPTLGRKSIFLAADAGCDGATVKNIQMKRNQQGFTLAELLVSSTVFLLLAGAAFSLLARSSQRFKTDSQVLTSFQEARLGIDQITRDIADGGFPPRNHFNSAIAPVTSYAASPFAWAPGYPVPCTVGGTCTVSPTGFDLIIETDYDGTGVKWIRYQLPAGTTTLLRAVAPKTVGGDPDASTNGAGVLLPYLQNVMN